MYQDRLGLYRQLEDNRGSKLLVYVTGDRRGLETIGPFLVVSCVVVLVLHEVIVRRYPVHGA